MSRGQRKTMITRDHPELSLSRQCRLLSISRSWFYFASKGETQENLALMRRIDALFFAHSDESGHRFRRKAATCSDPKRPLWPRVEYSVVIVAVG